MPKSAIVYTSPSPSTTIRTAGARARAHAAAAAALAGAATITIIIRMSNPHRIKCTHTITHFHRTFVCDQGKEQ